MHTQTRYRVKLAHGWVSLKSGTKNIAKSQLPKVAQVELVAHHILDQLKIMGQQTLTRLQQSAAKIFLYLDIEDTMAVLMALRDAESITVKYNHSQRSWSVTAAHVVEEIDCYLS